VVHANSRVTATWQENRRDAYPAFESTSLLCLSEQEDFSIDRQKMLYRYGLTVEVVGRGHLPCL
jgi:hypothetical protein